MDIYYGAQRDCATNIRSSRIRKERKGGERKKKYIREEDRARSKSKISQVEIVGAAVVVFARGRLLRLSEIENDLCPGKARVRS